MPNTIFSRPDLTAFTCLDGVGWRRRASACGQTMRCWRAGSLVRIGGVDAAGVQGEVRDTVVRRPAHEPYGWRPTIVHVCVAPLPVPGVCSCVAPGYEPSGPAARQALAVGGALGAHWASRSSCDGGAHRPGPGHVPEEPPTPLSWVKASVS